VAKIPKHEFPEVAEARHGAGSVLLSDAGDPTRARTVARLRILWDERRLLFRTLVYSLVVFTIVAFVIPKSYESRAQLMPPDDQSSSGMALAAAMAGKMDGGLSGLAGGILGLKSSGDLFIGVLGSRTVQDALITRFDLRKVYRQRLWEEARKKLTANTTFSQDRKSGIITISVSDRNPERAAAMAQEYVAELNAVVNRLTTSSARRERIFLEERLAQVRQDLGNAETDFSQFASKNAIIDIKEQGRAMVGTAATLEGQLIASQAELQGLKQIYSDHSVRVRAQAARIAELQSRMEQLGGKEDIADDATRSDRDDLYPSLRKLPLLGVPYADLYRRTRVQEAVFETLTQEYELAKVAEAKEIPSVKVLDAPSIPEEKSFPPRAAIMMVGTFLTLALSALAVLGKERWHQLHAEDPQKMLVREVVRTLDARMPWAPPNGSRLQAMSHNLWLRLERRARPSSADVESNN